MLGQTVLASGSSRPSAEASTIFPGSLHTNTASRDPVVSDFLAEDDGQSLLAWAECPSSFDCGTAQPPTIALWRAPTLSSIKSARTTLTEDSVTPHLRHHGVVIPLSSFCNLIGQCASLERAQILTVECHKRWTTFGVLHRYLIFHLRRPGRHDVWLRLDRRPTRSKAFQKLLLGAGRTLANDTALLAATKSELVDDPMKEPENLLTFTTPPNLGAFKFILSVITEELLEYKIWPVNCWFLCSLLQELLAEASGGVFVMGRATHPGLARGIRARVFDRVFHVPSGSSIPSLLQSIALKERNRPHGAFVSAFKQAKELKSPFWSYGLDTDTMRRIDALVDCFNALLKFLDDMTACQIASRGVALTRRLCAHDPVMFRDKHITSLNTYTSQLFAAGRPVEACTVAEETLEVFEDFLQSTSSGPKARAPSDPEGSNVPDISWTNDEHRGALSYVVGAYRFMYEQDPERYYHQLVKALGICARFLFRMNLQHAARDTELEIVSVYRDMHARDPEKYHEQFSDMLEACDNKLAGLTLSREVRDRMLKNQERAGSPPPLAPDMNDWSTRLAMRLERVDMFRALYRLDHDRYVRPLRDALHTYADFLSQAGEHHTWEAGEVLSAAARIGRRHPPVWDVGDADDRSERLYKDASMLRTLAPNVQS